MLSNKLHKITNFLSLLPYKSSTELCTILRTIYGIDKLEKKKNLQFRSKQKILFQFQKWFFFRS